MEEVAWKCTVAFTLGAATHYLLANYLNKEIRVDAPHSVTLMDMKKAEETPTLAAGKVEAECIPSAPQASQGEISESSSDDNEWVGKHASAWEPHKMVLCVRTDLKMGTGRSGLLRAQTRINYMCTRKDRSTVLSCYPWCVPERDCRYTT